MTLTVLHYKYAFTVVGRIIYVNQKYDLNGMTMTAPSTCHGKSVYRNIKGKYNLEKYMA